QETRLLAEFLNQALRWKDKSKTNTAVPILFLLFGEPSGSVPTLTGACNLRHWSQDNPSVPVAQLQHNRIVNLNGMLFAVNANNKVNGRGPFRDSLDRRRRCYDVFRRVCDARYQISRHDAPTCRRAFQTQARRIGFRRFARGQRINLEQSFTATHCARVIEGRSEEHTSELQ